MLSLQFFSMCVLDRESISSSGSLQLQCLTLEDDVGVETVLNLSIRVGVVMSLSVDPVGPFLSSWYLESRQDSGCFVTGSAL